MSNFLEVIVELTTILMIATILYIMITEDED
jgi:hypothetical protein